MNLRQIDLQKRKIEAKHLKPIAAIFKNMNKDALVLYKATKNIPADKIAANYTLEFTKVVRDAMRESIGTFGFIERNNLTIKQNKSIDAAVTEEELRKINDEFAKEAITFIATEAQRQAFFIEKTNAEQLTRIQQDALIVNAQKQAKLQSLIDDLTAKINGIKFSAFMTGEQVNQNSINALTAKLERIKTELNLVKQKQNEDIANYIEFNLLAKEEARTQLIAEMSVGIAESWAREKEVLMLAIALGEEDVQKKAWRTNVDGKERHNHLIANGQIVGINQKFIVGGYPANYPRDPNLPMKELANCRCGVEYIKS